MNKLKTGPMLLALMTVVVASALAQPSLVTIRDPWRALNGKTNQVSRSDAVQFEGSVLRVQDDRLWITGKVGGKEMEFVVVHFPYKVHAAEDIGAGHELYAWAAGAEKDTTVTNAVRLLPKFDYGTPCLPIPAQISSAAEFADAKYAAGTKKAAGYKAAFESTRDHALAGDAESRLKLGELYLTGHGCKMDTNQARIWLQKAAAQGNDQAAKHLQAMSVSLTNAVRAQ